MFFSSKIDPVQQVVSSSVLHVRLMDCLGSILELNGVQRHPKTVFVNQTYIDIYIYKHILKHENRSSSLSSLTRAFYCYPTS
jgi:hypothetical protein